MDDRRYSPHSISYPHSRLSDIAVSSSNLFPVVYGALYHFDPSKRGVLYLPMLAGSLLAECRPGQVGDKFVSSDFSCPLGMLGIIDKCNTKYAARNKGISPESSTTALHQPEDGVRKGGSRIPEARLVITLFGMFVCIVRGFRFVSKISSIYGDSLRPAFCGLVMDSRDISIGHI
jgi:hypothetical protein